MAHGYVGLDDVAARADVAGAPEGDVEREAADPDLALAVLDEGDDLKRGTLECLLMKK